MIKKTYSFRFSDETIKQLDKVCKHFKDNRTLALEKMINDRYGFLYDKNVKPVVKFFDNILKAVDKETETKKRSLKMRKRQMK